MVGCLQLSLGFELLQQIPEMNKLKSMQFNSSIVKEVSVHHPAGPLFLGHDETEHLNGKMWRTCQPHDSLEKQK